MLTDAKDGASGNKIRVQKAGGINGRYYSNLWLQGEPSAKTIDANVNFNWGSGLVSGEAADMVDMCGGCDEYAALFKRVSGLEN